MHVRQNNKKKERICGELELASHTHTSSGSSRASPASSAAEGVQRNMEARAWGLGEVNFYSACILLKKR
jgi:hypothetical protein